MPRLTLSIAIAIALGLTVLGGLLHTLTILVADSAPKQAAGAALAIGLAVIPYCFARLLEMRQASHGQPERQGSATPRESRKTAAAPAPPRPRARGHNNPALRVPGRE